MQSITCDVIDARDGRPIIGMPVMLRSLSQTTPLKTVFRGCTAFDGQIHLWRPEGDLQGGRLDDFIQDLENTMDKEEICSKWQMGFDTLSFFGRDATSWPMLNVIFYLTRRKFWTHHVSVLLGPYEYTTSITMRPIVNMERNFVRATQTAHASQYPQDTELGSDFGGPQMANASQHPQDTQLGNFGGGGSQMANASQHPQDTQLGNFGGGGSQMAYASQYPQDTELDDFGGPQMAHAAQHRRDTQLGSDSEVTVYSGGQTTSNANVQRPKPARQFLSHDQRAVLKQAYAIDPYPRPHVYDQLSSELGISKRKVRQWYASVRFQRGLSKIKVQRSTSQSITESLPIAIDPTLLSEHGDGSSPGALASSPDEAELGPFMLNDEVVDDNVEALPCDHAGRKRDCKGRFAKSNAY